MSTPTWVTLANANQFNQVNAGTAVSSFTAATDVSAGTNVAGQAYQTVPAQLYPGQMWRFSANGTWSSTASPNLLLGIYYGGVSGSPICAACVSAGSIIANAASVPWTINAMGKLTTVGASVATWQVIGRLAGLSQFGTTAMMPQYRTDAAYDTSTAKLITVGAACSASSASNAVTVYNWAIEYLTEP